MFLQRVNEMDITGQTQANQPAATMLDEDVHIWMEQDAIHLKVVTPYGDPVEITGIVARRLAAKLLEMADQLDE